MIHTNKLFYLILLLISLMSCNKMSPPGDGTGLGEIRVLKEDQWDLVEMDPFFMDSVYLEGDSLHLRISYSGGCRDHQFILWKLPQNEKDPNQIEVMLAHDSNDDPCEAEITEWLAFSLIPLREPGKHGVTFLLRGTPEMSAYFGEYTYKY